MRKQIGLMVGVALLGLAACEEEPSPSAKQPPAAPPAVAGTPPPAPESPAKLTVAGESFTIPGGWVFQLPDNWRPQPPANAMRLAELHVGDPALVAAFSMAGGDAGSNIQRWSQQFRDETGNAPEPEVQTREIGGRTVHLVHLRGEYLGMGQQAPEPGTMLHGAIIENATPGQHLFIKMTGPAARMESLREPFVKMVESVRKE